MRFVLEKYCRPGVILYIARRLYTYILIHTLHVPQLLLFCFAGHAGRSIKQSMEGRRRDSRRGKDVGGGQHIDIWGTKVLLKHMEKGAMREGGRSVQRVHGKSVCFSRSLWKAAAG